jgi:malate dehydrogenase (oxaloacetate-decarboxylating)
LIFADGEEILGIGDQGVGGILISIAKLVLTTLCAGIHPNRTLPVVLDCGTDNEELLNDELYLGLRKPRVRGKQYDEFIDTFVKSARKLYPKAYIHFEDFGLPNGTLTAVDLGKADTPQLEESWIVTGPRFLASTTMCRALDASRSRR